MNAAAPMLRLLVASLCLVGAGANPGRAETTSTYGQHLLNEEASQHPGISGLEMRLPKMDLSGPHSLTWGKIAKASLHLKLLDVTGTAIGDLNVSFPHASVLTAAQQRAITQSIRDELRLRTLDSLNLTDAFPYDPHFAQATYGQHVLDETLRAHRDVIVIGFHAKPSETAESVILASNFGRIGKADDAGDLKIVASGQPESVVTKDGNRCNFGLPLQDILGHTIGLLTVAYPYADGDDKAALLARALRLRNEVGHRLLNRGSLVEKYPLDPNLPAHSYAQALVEQILRAHPHVIGIAMHVTPPGLTDNLILASTFGRVGQVSDESDLDMIRSGKQNMHVLPGNERFSGEMLLHDSAGRPIGAMLTIFPYKAGDDTASMLLEAEQIQQEMAALIQNVAALMKPA